jgi:hypothetical protein
VEPLPGLGCRAEGQLGEVSLVRRGAVKALMWTLGIVEIEIASNGPRTELAIMHRLDRLHLEYPFAGSRMLRGLLGYRGGARSAVGM